MAPRWQPAGTRGHPDGTQMAPRWHPDGTSWHQLAPAGTQMASRWHPDGTQMAPRWHPDGIQMASRWDPDGIRFGSGSGRNSLRYGHPALIRFSPCAKETEGRGDPEIIANGKWTAFRSAVKRRTPQWTHFEPFFYHY